MLIFRLSHSILVLYRKPARSHIETEVVCTIPHKVTLLASGAQDSTAKHPKKGVRFNFNVILRIPINSS